MFVFPRVGKCSEIILWRLFSIDANNQNYACSLIYQPKIVSFSRKTTALKGFFLFEHNEHNKIWAGRKVDKKNLWNYFESNIFSFQQKFRFCGDCDCPDWVLAEIHSSLAVLSSVKLKILTNLVLKSLPGEEIPVSVTLRHCRLVRPDIFFFQNSFNSVFYCVCLSFPFL